MKMYLRNTMFILLIFTATGRLKGQSYGTFDPSFGNNGITFTTVGTLGKCQGESIGVNGDKILVAGSFLFDTYFQNFKYFILQYNSDGSLDNNFGIDGIIKFEESAGCCPHICIAISPDGKIVVAYQEGSNSVWVRRFNSNGTPDVNFGTGGYVEIEYTVHFFEKMVVQSDKKILVVGLTGSWPNNNNIILRFNVDGSPDVSFGINGSSITNLASTEYVNSCKVLPDSKILLAGWTPTMPFMARFKSNGFLDSTFNNTGIKLEALGDYVDGSIEAMVLQNDNKIVVIGRQSNSGLSKSILGRYDYSGKPDSTFGTNGLIVINDADDNYCWPVSIWVQVDGKILVGAIHKNDSDEDSSTVCIYRANMDGHTDSTFGVNGHLRYYIDQHRYWAYDFSTQNDGKIVVTGTDGEYPEDVSKIFTARIDYLVNAVQDNLSIIESLDASVYPNPATDWIILKLNFNKPEKVNVAMYDVLGNEVYKSSNEKLFASGKQELKVELPPGISSALYFVKVQTANEFKILKVIKK